MGQSIIVVDAFTDRPFAGNPAAVCVLPRERDEAWMQAVAREMNLSETAFVRSGTDAWILRWFTPAVEVDLCGHATLATAQVLWETGKVAPDQSIRFGTRSGLLTAERKGEWIELDFPATPETPAPKPEGLSRALGAAPRYVGRTRFDYLLELDDEAVVHELRPDFRKLAALGVRGVIATSRADDPDGGYDFVSRFFAPESGVPEDPVTGSAHCALAPYWAERLGKTELVGYQCSARGGTVRTRLAGDRVILAGQAVTVLRGELAVD
jgi:PhzF family phenazine biosynthesis protein